MSTRVNLLPKESAERHRASRARAGIIGAFVVLILVIGGVYFIQLQRVDDAQRALSEEEATLQALQADLADLEEYEDLRARRTRGDEVLQAAMGGEASMAGVLQDVASVMPPDAQLETMTVNVTGESEGQLGDVRQPWGGVTMAGQTRLGHAPGLERFLLELEKIAAFADLFFTSSTVDERGVSTFTAELDLGPEILTLRYGNGLPEVMR